MLEAKNRERTAETAGSTETVRRNNKSSEPDKNKDE